MPCIELRESGLFDRGLTKSIHCIVSYIFSVDLCVRLFVLKSIVCIQSFYDIVIYDTLSLLLASALFHLYYETVSFTLSL